MAELYSREVRTSVIYAVLLQSAGHFLRFLWIKPKVELAFLLIVSTCADHFKFLSRITPRYGFVSQRF